LELRRDLETRGPRAAKANAVERAKMDMRVDKTRDQRASGGVDPLGRRRHFDLARSANGPDATVLDDDDCVVD